MLCLELKVGEDIKVGEITIRTRASSNSRTRIFIDAPKEMKIVREPGYIPKKVKATSGMVLQ